MKYEKHKNMMRVAAVLGGLLIVPLVQVDAQSATSTATSTSATTTTATTSGEISTCGRPGTNNFIACYYQGRNFDTFKVQRTDPQIDFDWGTASPSSLLEPDNFSGKWWGLFNFDSGLYEFTATSDDGVRLNVANETIIDQWRDQPATTYTAQKMLTAGQHGIIAEFYENWGQALIKINWRKLDTGTTTATSPTSIKYYPNAFPTQWYILPGQNLGFNGNGFPPNATVTIQGGEVNYSVAADGSGRFSVSNVITVPFSWQNSTRTFTVKDGDTATPNPIMVSVGTFYPQITPSAWWIRHGTNIDVSGTGFAANEPVKLLVNGSQTAQINADNSGNVNFSFTVPGSGENATLTAQGVSSGQSSARVIYLHHQ